jgi:hypothetical protein
MAALGVDDHDPFAIKVAAVAFSGSFERKVSYCLKHSMLGELLLLFWWWLL